MKLTEKQRLFADEYIKSGNATQSAIKAGYATRSARSVGAENLTKPYIKAYIDKKMAEIESHKIADAKEAMQAITAIARGETKETQAQINPITGEWETVETPANLKTRLTAWREILKRYPLSNLLDQAQLKKLNAETRILNARAKHYEEGGADAEDLITKLIDTIGKEDKRESK